MELASHSKIAMPQPEYTLRVIKRALQQTAGQGWPAEALAAKIVEDLDLAEAIMGDGAFSSMPAPARIQARPNPSPGMIIAARPAYQEPDLNQGLLIGEASRSGQTGIFNPSAAGALIIEEAPPSAVVRNADMPASMDTPEEIETKKAALHGLILRTLPASLTVELPGLPAPIRLERFVMPGPANMNFIRVLFSQHQSEEDGPTLQFSTGDAEPFMGSPEQVTEIKNRILQMASMRYRANKPKIVARVATFKGEPDANTLEMRIGGTHGTDANVPQADIDDAIRLSSLPRIYAPPV